MWFNTFRRHIDETFQTLLSIHSSEGWRAVFKGLGPHTLVLGPTTGLMPCTYSSCKSITSETTNRGHDTALVHIGAAASALFVTSTVTNSFWLINTQWSSISAEEAGDIGMASTV